VVPLIAGTVVDQQGAPVPAATVFIAGGPVAVPDIAMLTGADGSFVINAPVPGAYRLGVRAGDDLTEVKVDVTAEGAPGVRVEMGG
jgi:hypothetical protein